MASWVHQPGKKPYCLLLLSVLCESFKMCLASMRSNILQTAEVMAIGRKSAGSDAFVIFGMAVMFASDHSLGQKENMRHVLNMRVKTSTSLPLAAQSSLPER